MILSYSNEKFKEKILSGTKIHTIRKNKGNRWKIGMKINHWMYSPRNPQKNPIEFLVGTCQSTQSIEIFHIGSMARIEIDGEHVNENTLVQLAKNDGFDSVYDFLIWFKDDFYGSIIHFTDFKYNN